MSFLSFLCETSCLLSTFLVYVFQKPVHKLSLMIINKQCGCNPCKQEKNKINNTLTPNPHHFTHLSSPQKGNINCGKPGYSDTVCGVSDNFSYYQKTSAKLHPHPPPQYMSLGSRFIASPPSPDVELLLPLLWSSY